MSKELTKVGQTISACFARNCNLWSLPSAAVNEQQAVYERVLKDVGGRQVVFRTLDIGGDKVCPISGQIRKKTRPWAGAHAHGAGPAGLDPLSVARPVARVGRA